MPPLPPSRPPGSGPPEHPPQARPGPFGRRRRKSTLRRRPEQGVRANGVERHATSPRRLGPLVSLRAYPQHLVTWRPRCRTDSVSLARLRDPPQHAPQRSPRTRDVRATPGASNLLQQAAQTVVPEGDRLGQRPLAGLPAAGWPQDDVRGCHAMARRSPRQGRPACSATTEPCCPGDGDRICADPAQVRRLRGSGR